MARHSSIATAEELESRTQAIGHELLAASRAKAASSLWGNKLIASALADDRFRAELFRFVDVFPVLKTPAAVHRHLLEYLEQPGLHVPAGMGVALKAGGLMKGMLARTIGSQIAEMGGTFIAGRNLETALPVLEKRWAEGIGFSVDVLGEACVSHAEASTYVGRYLELVEALPAKVSAWPQREVLERDHLGTVPRANVSIKVSALDGHVSPVDTEGSLDRLTGALAPILQAAERGNVLINFDMEQHSLKELTIELFKRCCERFNFPAGIAMQAYLRSANGDARDMVQWARSRGRVVTVRLIKGAYWDYENIHAEMMGWPVPVWARKRQTDACFERVANDLIREMPREPGKGGVKLALGTHNVRSVAWGMACLEQAGLPTQALEFQALRGMAEGLKAALVERHWRVREYMPLGEMIPGMAYLVRRLLENTSNEGWLHAGETGQSEAVLLASPHEIATSESTPRAASEIESETSHTFANEPLHDFSQAKIRDSFAQAVTTAHLAHVSNDATLDSVHRAIESASAAFPAWRDAGIQKRAAILRAASAAMRKERDALSAQIILESHKTWLEADGDVCEAIDFCDYYAQEALALFAPKRLGHFTGEHNDMLRHPRGIAAIISPWNFPLSICTGMTVAALVTGNTAIVKPAEQTPAIARRLCEILWAAGVPKAALHFLPGPGEVVGAALVRDPRVAIIAFTGSKEVGLGIVKAAGDTPAGQNFVKRVICEMGGKNAVIIDESADLDEAVLGIRQSAFGYSGQKCSAASRVIVLDSIHDAFVARLIESTRALIVGDPRDPATDLGPVIDAEAAQKIRRYIDLGKQEATLAYPEAPLQIENRKSGGGKIENLIVPHIFTSVLPSHRIAREEIFGPVLSILRARDFDHALALANDSAYKLTGGIYSRTPSH
ncbi:MAG TPA: proline dehydrogenase family protein, partial [Phycisphaerae bacterium]